MFDRAMFDSSFKKNLSSLKSSEKRTKELVRSMSRDVLEAHHATEDVKYINEFISVLSPMNKRTAVLYFKEFSGFQESEGMFSKKDKKHYEEKKAAAIAFLEDPLNNLWSWSEKNVEVEKKPFDISRLQAQVSSLMKKVEGAEIPHSEVIKALFQAGITVADVVSILEEVKE